jgi:hypothetical protein
LRLSPHLSCLPFGRNVNPRVIQHPVGDVSITMILDRYSHWIPSMGHHAAEGMDEVLS